MSLFVLALVIVVVSNIFISTSEYAQDEQGRIIVGEEAARIFSRADETLRQAKGVSASAVINGTTYTSDSATLVVELPALLSDSTLSGTDSDVVVIGLDTSSPDNTRIRLIQAPHANSTRDAIDTHIVNHVKDFYIRYTDSVLTEATAVTITASVERTLNRQTYQQTAVLYAAFRNHP